MSPEVVRPCTCTATGVPIAPDSSSVTRPVAASTCAETESEPPLTKAVTVSSPMPVGIRVVSCIGLCELFVYVPPCGVAVNVSRAVTRRPVAVVKAPLCSAATP
ncbi:MAG: hypothetical protein GQE15_33515 [Archangiaceae bacterium]|nr:hypothetical protein [Archangiaceae bacterium]